MPKPKIVLIECCRSMHHINDIFQSVWWSQIPDDMVEIVMNPWASTVLYWKEDFIYELYSSGISSFKEFSENTNSLLKDCLLWKKDAQIFIFATKHVLSSVHKSITLACDDLSKIAEVSFYNARSQLSKSVYILKEREHGGGIIFEKALIIPHRLLPLQSVFNPHRI